MTDETKFSKGIWKVGSSGGSIVSENNGEENIIAILETVPLKISPETEYNAYLMAASPDLFKALEILLENCKFYNTETMRKISVPLKKAKAAIAKAKGEKVEGQ